MSLVRLFIESYESLMESYPDVYDYASLSLDDDRFKIVGCQHVEGFDAVARGEKVPLENCFASKALKLKGWGSGMNKD